MSGFVCLSDGKGNAFFFPPAYIAKAAQLKYPPQFEEPYEILDYTFCEQQLKDRSYNIWRYNLITGGMESIALPKAYDYAGVLQDLSNVDFSPIAGDMYGMQRFVRNLHDHPFHYDGKGLDDLSMVQLYDNKYEAENAWHTYYKSCGRTFKPTEHLQNIRKMVRDSARGGTWASLLNYCQHNFRYAGEVAYYVTVHFLGVGFEFPPESIAIVDQRWAVVERGYGLFDSLENTIFAYKPSEK